MSKRAVRRHHYKRLKEKRIRDHYWGFGTDQWDKEPTDNLVGISVETPQVCSSYCCGNPRKHFHDRTAQELRSEADFNQQLDDYQEWEYD